MIAGHYATALIPYELTRRNLGTPFWIFLLAAQFLDLAMLALVQLGIEDLRPPMFMDFAFSTSSSNMWLSHDIIPVVLWSVAVGLLFWGITRKSVVALWCGALVVVHELCDLLVGYTHHLQGDNSPSLGLNLYQQAPVVGLLLEAGLCAAIVTWFCWRRARTGAPVSSRLKWGLYAVLVGSVLATLPIATRSLNAWIG
jgi:hypothetical protein